MRSYGVKQLVKNVMWRIAPEWIASVFSARARAHSQRVLAEWGLPELNRKLFERLGDRVLSGPFAGMVLTPMTSREQMGPCLLGSYESELHAAWSTVFRGSYARVIDVGAKFGYYAVGLGRMWPTASVFAFDTDWWARRAVREMARANGVANIEVRGFCTPAWLREGAGEPAFIISDCEGYEAALFAPPVIAALRTATLIIETHDQFVPGVSERLERGFGGTHLVRTFQRGSAPRRSPVDLAFLPERERGLATREVSPRQVWLLCLPKEGPNAQLASRAAGTCAESG